MATQEHGNGEPTEEQLRAAYEAELKRVRVEHVLLEDVVTLINLGMRRTGLVPGTEDERDPAQVMLAVDAVRALAGIVERVAPGQAPQIKEALSQLQLAFVRSGGAAAAQPAATGAARAATAQTAAAGGRVAGGAAAGAGGVPKADGVPGAGGAPAPEPIKPGEPGPAQRSGRLWVPGR